VTPEDPDLRAALAIADGESLDWADTTPGSPGSSPLATELRFLEAVRLAHRAVEPGAMPVEVLDSILHPAGAPAGEPVERIVNWGPLTVLEKIGRGSFGDVYRAWDPRLDREVALKLLRHASSGPDPVATAVVEEGRLLARVRHPNVMTVYGAERVDGRAGLWMELVEGHTLADEVRAGGPMAPADVAAVGADVCAALAAVHEAGLVHRDVKAQNVLRDRAGRVVLGDFGAGVEFTEDTALQPAGTPLYLAPGVLEGRPASAATDLYSAGVLLYHLATASFPVEGHSLRDLRQAHRSGRLVPLLQRRPGFPAGLARLIEALLETGPDRPPLDAASTARSLREWLQDAAPRHAFLPDSRVRRLSAVGAVCALVAVGAAAVWSARGRSNDGPTAGGATILRLIAKDPECTGPLSPDGLRAACVARTSRNIAVYDLASGRTREITSGGSRERGETGAEPVFSPDGERVAYRWSRRGAADEIRVSEADGGEARTLATASPGENWTLLGWQPDEDVLLAARSGPHGSTLVWIDARSGAEAARQRIDLPPGGVVRFFGWSQVHAVIGLQAPGGTVQIAEANGQAVRLVTTLASPPQFARVEPTLGLLAFDALQRRDAPERDIRVLTLKSGQVQSIASHPAFDLSPFWAPGGTHLLFSSDRGGPMGLWAVPVREGGEAAGEPELVRELGRRVLVPVGFAPDGTLHYSVVTGDFDVFTADLGPGGAGPTAPVRVSSRVVDINTSPAWSPDGRALAVVSSRGPFSNDPGATRVIVHDLEAGRAREFGVATRLPSAQVSWSPDGRRLALKGFLGDTWGVHLLDAAAGTLLESIEIPASSRFVEQQLGQAVWGGDGHTLILVRDQGITVFDLESRRLTEVVTAADGRVRMVAVSPDSRLVACSVARDDRRWSVRVAGLDDRPARDIVVADAGEAVIVETWTPDGRDVLFTRFRTDIPWKDRREQLWRVDADGGAARSTGLEVAGMREVRMHPDGRRVAFTAGYRTLELWALEGLAGELAALRR
jgi:serine/threonine-protein kinase